MNFDQSDYKHLSNTSVGHVVAKNYKSAEIFSKYGIDFCCGGGISIEEACKKKQIDTNDVLSDLKKLDQVESKSQNFNAWDIDYLIDHIIDTHHRFVRNKTVEISAYANKVAKVYGKQYPENVTISQKFDLLSEDLIRHLSDEEETVFPLIRSVKSNRTKGIEITKEQIDSLNKHLVSMITDHDGAGQILKELRNLSNNYTPPTDACTTYRVLYNNLELFESDLHMHVHLENNILFKKAEQYI
ncbi:MAG: iron-sulfur cluster repair di-iron protein [Balneolaceae bacterium]